MSTVTGERRNGLATRPLREYYARVLAYLTCAATLAAGVYTQHFSIELLWMVPYTLQGATHATAHIPHQPDATRGLAIGALHRNVEGADLHGGSIGDRAAG